MTAKAMRPHVIDRIEGHTRAFLQVQNGCDHRCTFCIIPFGRGNSRSLPMDEVVAQARRVVENGYREIVLTGVDITSYGAEFARSAASRCAGEANPQGRAGSCALEALLDRTRWKPMAIYSTRSPKSRV